MKNVAIICEFDPLHLGHIHLISSLREMGAKRIICIMSGAFCQRGDTSTFSRAVRAECAVEAGADVVLELPFPWSCSSAEFFAHGAMSLIKSIGNIDTLGFGSECGDVSSLILAAERMRTGEFRDECARISEENKNLGAAAVQSAAYKNLYGNAEVLTGANNILAIEYIKSAKRLGVDIDFKTVRRIGDGHGEKNSGSKYASASHIREMVGSGDTSFWRFVSERSYRAIMKEIEQKKISGGIAAIGDTVLYHFRLDKGSSDTAEMRGGLYERACALSVFANSYEKLFESMKTKKYTDARLRRAIVFSLLGVKSDMLKSSPEYTTLLGATTRGTRFLKEVKKTAVIPIVSSPAATHRLGHECDSQLLMAERALRLRSLTLLSIDSAISEGAVSPYIAGTKKVYK